MVLRALKSQVNLPEAAGLLHATASIGPSFERLLLPRTTIQQAGITGVISAVNYGVTTTLQSAVEAISKRVAGDLAHGPKSQRAVMLGSDLFTLAASYGVVRLLRQKPQESVTRASARTAAWRVAVGAGTGAVAVVADAAVDLISREDTPSTVSAPVVLAVGAAIGSGIHIGRSRRLLDTAAETDQYGAPVRKASVLEPIQAMVVGVGISGMLYGASRVESFVAAGLGHLVGYAIPGLRPISRAIGHGMILTAFAITVERGIAFANTKTEQAGNAIEPAYETRPDSDYVSGGPRSKVDWDTIGREGRRFVNMALTPDRIEAVTQKPAISPIRAFVGYDSAESPNARAYLAMEELDRFGAFERPYIVLFSPTGSGYVNYVAAETLEFLTGGNCASVCIQYSLRPSFLSLDRVGTAWESELALLTALAWRIKSIPEDRRPKLMIFGESLGSQSAQDVFEKEGVQGFDILEISRALFVGTPYASKWRQQWHQDPEGVDPLGKVVEVASASEWNALADERRDAASVILLTHHEDPIPKVGPILAVQRPDWLGNPEDRPPGVPPETRYWPLFTFLLTAIDLLNADNVVPGKFDAYGHDYRADLPEMVRIAFQLDTDEATMERIEAALRRRELAWAERRVIAEAFHHAEKSVRDKLEGWGVDHTVIPGIVSTPRPTAPDPYQAPLPEE